ncbi:MAG: hypothetical protein E7408_00155 [Ruminococcaceae bacterium]|nr:hypothetical protein [Oscillospiraceae bacterium]
MTALSQCESCAYFLQDEGEEEASCAVSFDMDELSVLYGGKNTCPYYRFYDEYKMVQKQN